MLNVKTIVPYLINKDLFNSFKLIQSIELENDLNQLNTIDN